MDSTTLEEHWGEITLMINAGFIVALFRFKISIVIPHRTNAQCCYYSSICLDL